MRFPASVIRSDALKALTVAPDRSLRRVRMPSSIWTSRAFGKTPKLQDLSAFHADVHAAWQDKLNGHARVREKKSEFDIYFRPYLRRFPRLVANFFVDARPVKAFLRAFVEASEVV